jgi:hypothetical protein
MKKASIIFFIIFNFLTDLIAQDTIVSISFKAFHSPYDESEYVQPFDIFSNFTKNKIAFSSEIELSYSKFDLHGGIEYLKRGFNIRDYAEFHNPDQGPFGSYSSTTKIRTMNYSGSTNNLILKLGTDFKIFLFKKFICLKPGIDLGYSFQVSKKENINETRIENTWSYYNGQDSTYGGGSRVEIGLATDNMDFNKNLFFTDYKLGLSTNKGKWLFNLTAGYRKYFPYFLKYTEITYYYERLFSRDKYWEISIGYRL